MPVDQRTLAIVREALAEARLKMISKGVTPDEIGPAVNALQRIQRETGKSIMEFDSNPADVLAPFAEELVHRKVMQEVAKSKDDQSDPKNDVFGDVLNPKFAKGI